MIAEYTNYEVYNKRTPKEKRWFAQRRGVNWTFGSDAAPKRESVIYVLKKEQWLIDTIRRGEYNQCHLPGPLELVGLRCDSGLTSIVRSLIDTCQEE